MISAKHLPKDDVQQETRGSSFMLKIDYFNSDS